MKSFTGGSRVKGGYYWHRGAWDMTVLPAEGGTLPGEASHRFVRVPVLALLLLGPVAGAFYVVVLPFVGVYLLGRQLVTLGARSLGRTAKTAERTKKI